MHIYWVLVAKTNLQIENPGSFQRIAPSHCNLMSNKRRIGEKAAATLHYRKRCLGQIGELGKRPGYHRAVMAFIACGIALNCIPVVIYGIRALRENRARGERIGSFWDRKAREQHRRENPHMLRDTLVLTVATVLPFVCFATVLFDVLKMSRP